MDLNIFKKDEGSTENYWSLVVGKTWVQAGIWRVSQEKVELVAEGNSTTWSDGNEESLVSAADGSLSSAASNTTFDVSEPNKVVYGLPASWVSDGSILPQRLELLKKLSGELELAPSGFVVVPEALVHYLKSKEGSPLNAILIGIAEDSSEVTLTQNGKVLGTTEVARSISLGADLSEGLAKLTPSLDGFQYPSRILLYNHKVGNLDDARQNLISTEWKEVNLNFLHTPKIEVLPENTAVLAVSLAGGAEVGEAVSVDFLGLDKAKNEETEVSLGESSDLEVEKVKYLEDEDIAYSEKISQNQDVNFEKEIEDLDLVAHDNLRSVSEKAEARDFNPFPEADKSKDLSIIKRALSHLSFPNLSLSIFKGWSMGFVAALTFILLIVFGIGYWYLPKAEVTIYVAAKKLEKTIPFSVDSQIPAVDLGKSIVPAKTEETEVSGEKTTSTTGTKLIGDRAKGTVIITNGGGSRVLKSGTILAGPNSLKFTLNEDVTVASASSIAKPSQSQAQVSAADIGAQYNLANGTEFVVGNFSKLDIVAQNDEAFSGGSSREITAVSDKDRLELEKGLMQELAEKGKEQLKDSLSPDEVLIDESISFTSQEKNYSNKAGEEASTLKLSTKGNVKSLVVSKESINSLVLDKIKSDVPGGFLLRPDQLNLSFKAVVQKEETKASKNAKETKEAKPPSSQTSFVAQIQANLLPKINPEDIKKGISGKSAIEAKEYLSSIPGFTRTAISFKPRLPSFLETLPRMTKNIVLEIESER